MRYMLAAALAVAVAAPVAADDTWQPSEREAFWLAMYHSGVRVTTGWNAAFRLHRCNVAASKRLGTERTGLAVVGLPIETEAAEAMVACTSDVEALAKVAPVTEVEAIKTAIVRANAKTIAESRNPPNISCAMDVDELRGLCSRKR